MAKDEFWQQETRKLGGETLVVFLETLDDRVKQNTADILRLDEAFPSKDVDGHRRYHQLIIDNTEAKRALTKAIKEKTISGLLWSAVVWAASEAWSHLPKLFER